MHDAILYFLVQLLCSPTKMSWEHMAGSNLDQEELLIFAAGLGLCPLLLILIVSPSESCVDLRSVDLELFVVF